MKRRGFITWTAIVAVAMGIVSPFRVFARSERNRDHQEELAETAQRIKGELHDALMDSLHTWFPRCLDTEYGGFLCDFDAKWNSTGPHDKMLEYQARQTRAAAQAALYDPELEFCREAAEHGFRYLHDRMWDDQYGGWYHKLNRTGQPMESETKHGHGFAYAIQACIAYHRLTGSLESLRLAHKAFLWLEKHAYDSINGGYFSFYQRDGTLILSVEENPINDYGQDHMGTPIGLRDENTALDLMEGLADLYNIKPDPLIEERLIELVKLCIDRLVVAPGFVQKYFHRDWSPAPSELELGLTLQTSRSLSKVSTVLENKAVTEIEKVSHMLVDSCIHYAWDPEKGGFYYLGKMDGDHIRITSKEKAWWVQAEGLRSLLAVVERQSNAAIDYFDYFIQQWNYIRKYIIDSEYKGWHKDGRDTTTDPGIKANEWKDASHEVRAMIESIQVLDEIICESYKI